MMVVIEILALLVGFYFLAKGSDWLVNGATSIARGLGVRPLVLGLTVVAWGTSAPELVVSGLAAYEGQIGISMGNVLGSNAANIGLVLGCSALVLPAVLQARLGWREAFWLLASVAVFWWRVADGEVSRLDGCVLLGAMTIYTLQLWWEARQTLVGVEAAEPPSETWLDRHPKATTLLGIVMLSLSAKAVMIGSIGLAERAGLSDVVIGLTVIAIGTSLPELAAGVSGALKGHSDISIGNVVGSNVFNVLGVIGVVGVIHPFGGPADPETEAKIIQNVSQDFPVVMAFSLAAILIPLLGGAKAGRFKGFLLLGSWLAYTAYLIGWSS